LVGRFVVSEREHVGLGAVPDGAVAGGLDVEPVVEDEFAPERCAELWARLAG